MGNSLDLYNNPKFMVQYYQKQKIFLSQTPLYDVQDIKFPLSTKGMKIIDKTGRRVKIAGVNWSGGHAQRHCVGGLQTCTLQQIAQYIKYQLDLNTVRLTFSLEMFYKNNIIQKKLILANPKLYGKTSMQIFDETIRVLTQKGIMVYLNNHTGKSQWCCSNNDGDGLWYSKDFTQYQFNNCLLEMAKRYKNNPRVIGIDLKNQIRKSNGINPTWGDKNPQTDWHMAAQYIGKEIQKIAPQWLIIVGGLFYQMDLTGVYQHPIRLTIPNKLVYSGHIYGFSWATWVALLWKINDYKDFKQRIFNQQLFVRNFNVPFLFGQFGNNQQDNYWLCMMSLLRQTDIDWTYWCLDGYKCAQQQDQTYGLLTRDFKKIRYNWMVKQLKQVSRPKKIITKGLII